MNTVCWTTYSLISNSLFKLYSPVYKIWTNSPIVSEIMCLININTDDNRQTDRNRGPIFTFRA